MREERETIGWCSYCKDPIYEGEDYVVSQKDKYHKDCYKQKQCFDDPFDPYIEE